MFTMQEVEMLASLLQRAGVNVYEMTWANGFLDRLRVIALEYQTTLDREKEDETEGGETT